MQEIGYTCDGSISTTDGCCWAKRLATAGSHHPSKARIWKTPFSSSSPVISWRRIWSQGFVLLCFLKGSLPRSWRKRFWVSSSLRLLTSEVQEESNFVMSIGRSRPASLLSKTPQNTLYKDYSLKQIYRLKQQHSVFQKNCKIENLTESHVLVKWLNSKDEAFLQASR